MSMTDQKVGWIRTGITLTGGVFAVAGIWTGLQVSLSEIRKDREYDQRVIESNRSEIARLKTYRGGDREQVIELKGDVKAILRSIQAIESALRARQRDERQNTSP